MLGVLTLGTAQADTSSLDEHLSCPTTMLTTTTIGVSLVQAVSLQRKIANAELNEGHIQQGVRANQLHMRISIEDESSSKITDTAVAAKRTAVLHLSAQATLGTMVAAASAVPDMPIGPKASQNLWSQASSMLEELVAHGSLQHFPPIPEVLDSGWLLLFVVLFSVLVCGISFYVARLGQTPTPPEASTPQQSGASSTNHGVSGSLGKQDVLLGFRTRLALHDTLWQLDEALVSELYCSNALPEQAFSLDRWRESTWELVLGPSSLQLNESTIANWSRHSTPDNQMHVRQLPEVAFVERHMSSSEQHLVEVADTADKAASQDTVADGHAVGTAEIASKMPKESPKTLHAFILRWSDGSSWRCIALGCREELVCSRWMTSLTDYADIQKWHESGDMWRLSSTITKETPYGYVDLPLEVSTRLSDNRNWRMQNVHLRQYRLKGLCLVCCSERDNSKEEVISVLAHPDKEGRARIKAHLPLCCSSSDHDLAEAAQAALVEQKKQMGATGSLEDDIPFEDCLENAAPDKLFPFEIQWTDHDLGAHRSVLACESEIERTLWIDRMKKEIEALSLDSGDSVVEV